MRAIGFDQVNLSPPCVSKLECQCFNIWKLKLKKAKWSIRRRQRGIGEGKQIEKKRKERKKGEIGNW